MGVAVGPGPGEVRSTGCGAGVSAWTAGPCLAPCPNRCGDAAIRATSTTASPCRRIRCWSDAPRLALLIEAGHRPRAHRQAAAQLPGREALPALEEDLAVLGLTPADIDFVVYTHMDWDHTSGGVRRVGGDLGLPFPGPATWCSGPSGKRPLTPTAAPATATGRKTGSPSWRAGRVELVDGDVELVPGVHLHLTGGHTHGHQVVRIEAGERDGAAHGRICCRPMRT